MDPYAELSEALRENRAGRAAELCRELILAAPDSVELLALSGTLARQRGEHEAALGFFERAALLNPVLPELQNNLAVVLEDLGRPGEAVGRYREALRLRPDYCDALGNLGNALRSLGQSAEALASYRAAIACDPGQPDAYYNLANSLRGEGQWREAVENYRKLLALRPAHLSGWINLGGSLLSLNCFDEAIQAERRALEIDPDSADAHWNLALALLATGDYRQGWREYQWRLKDRCSFPASFAGRPMWDGSPIAGKTLLLRCEQGLGDALQFFRYLPMLARAGARIVLECRPELLSLFDRQSPAIRCFAKGGEPPPFDCFCYLLSLPFLLGTTLSNLPAQIPYLEPDPALGALWDEKMPGGALKVGVVWAGSASYKNDRNRSLPPELLAPLAGLPGTRVYSLQMGEAAADLAALGRGEAVHDLSGGVRDFADTAAIIANLDLVVTVDTAVAHLAGALGKRTFLMLPVFCDWRWLTQRTDSPWYPTLRLYRQQSSGDWEPVLCAIARDLLLERDDPNRLFKAANALRGAGRPAEAVEAYGRLLALRPDLAEVHNNLGLALQDLGRLDQAAQSYRAALGLRPDLADARNNLGTVLVSQGDPEAAAPCFRSAITLRDDYIPAYVNLGSCLQRLERPEEALPLYRRAIELQPASIEARINLGTAYQELLQPERAIAVYEEALSISPGHAGAHWNLALSLLSIGEFQRGWREYEWRFDDPSPDSRTSGAPAGPRWDGAPLSGKTILLECEQGLGDTLQFVRYAPLVARLGARVLLRCQSPSLKPLLARVPGVAGVSARGEALPACDYHAPLLSLPRIFQTTLDRLPEVVPYLSPDPRRAEAWRSLLPAGPTLKVGLVWRGGPLPRNRACPYQELAPLAKLSGLSFFSLQLGEAPIPGGLPASDLSAKLSDFGESAAAMANLDLVITVDTAAAHLAGGMGVPVWTMLPHACDWRWLFRRTDSPWYPSMRIFRQQVPGDWSGVVSRIAAELSRVRPNATGGRSAGRPAGEGRVQGFGTKEYEKLSRRAD
jgi:tetratricopeptide (TPR) repeat protein